ncbi:MAG: tetratricopeptide repeat protein [Planctomycetes bacterium]|nr:tetratricopeptide repeat protein [Planctomycetota bacterium]
MIAFRRFLALIAILLFTGTLSAQEGRKLALLVGVQKYEFKDLTELKYAENDVAALGKILKDGGYQVVILSESEGKKDPALQPTHANVLKQLAAMVKGGKRADTMLVALSGHGAQFQGDSESYFCPSDARPEKETDKRAKLLPMTEVVRLMSDGGIGTKLIFVDACRNTPVVARGIDGSGIRPTKGSGIIFSCSREQRGHESEKLKHGIFFHFVIKGLQGDAGNGRGEVTWNSLVEYVSEQVPGEVEKLMGKGTQQEPITLADISGKSPSLLRAGPVRPVVVTKTEDASAHYRLGRELVDKDDVKGAHAAFEKAAAIEPKNADYVAWRGYTFTRQNEIGRAERDADEALRLDPKNCWAWNVKGIISNSRNEQDDAIKHYETAIGYAPEVHYFYLNLCMVLTAKGNFDEAIKNANKAIDLKPTDSFGVYFRAHALAARGQSMDAMKDIDKAIEIDPKRGYYYRDRATLYIKLTQYDKALEDCQAAFKNGADDAETYTYRGIAQHGLKDYEKALADYNQSLKLNPKLALTWKYRGMLHAKQNDYAKSIPDYNESIRLFDKDYEAFSERGVAFFFLKQHDKALPNFNKAIELAPNYPALYAARAMVLMQLGRTTEAQQDLTKAKQLLGN